MGALYSMFDFSEFLNTQIDLLNSNLGDPISNRKA